MSPDTHSILRAAAWGCVVACSMLVGQELLAVTLAQL